MMFFMLHCNNCHGNLVCCKDLEIAGGREESLHELGLWWKMKSRDSLQSAKAENEPGWHVSWAGLLSATTKTKYFLHGKAIDFLVASPAGAWKLLFLFMPLPLLCSCKWNCNQDTSAASSGSVLFWVCVSAVEGVRRQVTCLLFDLPCLGA